MRVLGIETSCDETGLAVYDTDSGLLAQALYSQIELHQEYGGVVPELASRDHIRKALPMLSQMMQEADQPKIDAVAYTRGPGLIGALLVGASLARGLAWGWGVPCLGVHHMEGHLLAPMLSRDKPEFPFVALLVSGGHTLLVHVEALGRYRILGESLDDAVGEAFDKTAKLLGLPYPGGPQLAAMAREGNAQRWRFPRPMTDRPGLDFSFSGLKTFALNTLQSLSPVSEADRADVAAAFEQAVVETLTIKCKRALQQTANTRLVVAGGVGANQSLRQSLHALCDRLGARAFFPAMEYCTDNGAMIAYAGAQRLQAGQVDGAVTDVLPRWSLEQLLPVD